MGSGSSSNQARQNNPQRNYAGHHPNNVNSNINPLRLPPPPPPLPAPPRLNNLNDMDALRNTMNAYLAMNGTGNARNASMLPVNNPNRTVVMNTDIAIRKKTLALIQIKNKEFFLSFNYDCVREVEISIFMFVEEKADHALITKDFICLNKSEPIAPSVNTYQAGKNIAFPKLFRINLDEIQPKFLFETQKNYYPLVIKMRKSPLQAPEERKILYHYIGFEMQDNEVKLKFLRQKIEFNGDAYEIQEIFGITSSEFTKDETNVAEVGDTEKECVVCFSDKIDTIIMPCRHMCLCITCAGSLQKSNKPQARKCPICRKNIESFIRLQREEKKK